MNHIEVVILLLGIIVLLSVVATKIRISYPTLLVMCGLGIGLIPGLPSVELKPEVVFLIFLPPLLYSSAWNMSLYDFKSAKRPITLLATGLVLFSTAGIAVTAHWLVPELSWELAFVLGAILSPPDAVAAASATKGLGVSKRIITILEGESLVNDASGLVAYKYAVAAVLTGKFIFWEAGLQFFLVAIAGVIIGLIVANLVAWIHTHTPDDYIIDTCLTFLTPYVAYILAERFHFSGVLAVVTAGLYLSWKSSTILSHEARLNAYSVWLTVIFLLNGIVFILIGLQLPSILEGITEYSLPHLVVCGLLLGLATMLLRITWVFPGAYVPRWLSKKIRETEVIDWRNVMIVAWTGMRGVVSLAAALSLPILLDNGQPFPHRDLILFLTFSVILFTLVVQSLSLPPLIRLLGIKKDVAEELEEIEARKTLASAAIVHIEENLSFGKLSDEVLAQIKSRYEVKFNYLRNYSSFKSDGLIDEVFDQFHNVQLELLNVERNVLKDLQKSGDIDYEVLRKLEYELDLEESRLKMEV
jgi:CPA1 family monovalent cation:H+ antiporter